MASRHFSAQQNVAFISTTYYFVQERRTQVSHHPSYTFIVASLLQFLQLKCEGKEDTPFNTHPRTIRVAISSLLIYDQLRFRWGPHLPPSYATVVGHAVRLVGYVSYANCINSTICEFSQLQQVGLRCLGEVSVARPPS